MMNKIIVLSGAGISAESGIKTFRDSNGLWENHSVEEVATPQGFSANPTLVYRFYNQRRAQLLEGKVKPNAAHFALSEFESYYPRHTHIITQNVDNLHEQAGSKNVLHMHGELLKAKCVTTNRSFSVDFNFDEHIPCPCCDKKGSLRPDIVWFGEVPYYMEEIEALIEQADVFISVGTSGSVYPAAGFVQLANAVGAHTIEVNISPSETKNAFAEHRYGLASEVLPKLLNELRSAEPI
ncbi:NAD-dependent deacylase [Ningiella sp. W23]|uniref:NAD-dependent deacylase n=1 Tax=Ningiella sp. W23 TaxID=3023715 RepID=UPI0037577E85